MKRLFNLVRDYGALCVGLDPNIDKMNKEWHDIKELPCIYDAFCRNVLRELKHLVKVVKFQSAYFEALGPEGLVTLRHLISDAKGFGYYTILDAKRSDISTTAEAYAKAAFDIYDVDSLTISPFMGEKSIRTFVDYARKKERQIFVVVFPTEASIYATEETLDETLELIQGIGDENLNNGYGDVGAVISGLLPPHSHYAGICRRVAPRVFFLIPGMGLQGGKIEDQKSVFVDKNGAILNYSRAIIYSDDPFTVAQTTLSEINRVLK